MSEWEFAQMDDRQQLAQLHFFAVKKQQADGEIEFQITVREFATQQRPGMRFFAEADKPTNQNTAPFLPCGWGNTLLKALSECIRSIERFPYEGPRD